MARKKPAESEFIAFDVMYQDGTQTSNRRVASADLDPIVLTPPRKKAALG